MFGVNDYKPREDLGELWVRVITVPRDSAESYNEHTRMIEVMGIIAEHVEKEMNCFRIDPKQDFLTDPIDAFNKNKILRMEFVLQNTVRDENGHYLQYTAQKDKFNDPWPTTKEIE